MKKSIIVAGAASAVLAAMPVFGVFAQTAVKDELTVNVQSSCELADITPSGVSTTNPNSYYGTGNPGELVTLSAGTSSTTGTATSVRIECNNATGYTITPTFTDLTGPGTAITYSTSTPAAANSGTWTAYYGGSTAISTAGIVVNSSTSTDTYTFSYKVGLRNTQTSGDYTGSATYTLGANS